MARPRSDDKRSAILSAAIRVIAAQGLGAPTATIAKEAGVSNGSLFTYFETKADLLNRLYVVLKAEMGCGCSRRAPDRERHPRRRCSICGPIGCAGQRAAPRNAGRSRISHVSDDITAESRQNASDALAGIRQLLERSRENGPMRDAPLGFVVALMSALADATIDFMIQDPANAENHCRAAFDALWRMVA